MQFSFLNFIPLSLTAWVTTSNSFLHSGLQSAFRQHLPWPFVWARFLNLFKDNFVFPHKLIQISPLNHFYCSFFSFFIVSQHFSSWRMPERNTVFQGELLVLEWRRNVILLLCWLTVLSSQTLTEKHWNTTQKTAEHQTSSAPKPAEPFLCHFCSCQGSRANCAKTWPA